MSAETEDPPTIPHGRFADQPIEAVPRNQLQWMQAMNVSVSDKIDQLLQRVQGVKRASDLDRPVVFDAAGERHANQVAERDRQQGGK